MEDLCISRTEGMDRGDQSELTTKDKGQSGVKGFGRLVQDYNNNPNPSWARRCESQAR